MAEQLREKEYPLFEALSLPADHRAFGAVMVGYAKRRYLRMPLRNEPRVKWTIG